MKTNDKYLGGPLLLGRSKIQEWRYLVNRLKSKLAG
uniref:Uncharacterized protein n=1 Tax=Nelumbo nucifera TaxID=4432 RepID=A0A822ZUL5_NELNU|nr:TPA_asm: hypothetical protein HUJ06_018600 [Nelumbo nucifera]